MFKEAYHDIFKLALPKSKDSHGDLHNMTLEEAITQPFTEIKAPVNLDINMHRQAKDNKNI